MNTLSINFIAFLFIVFCFTWVTKGAFRKIIFFIANIIFVFSFGNLVHIVYLFSLIVYTYLASLILRKNSSRGVVILLIIPIILGLAFFKYAGLLEFKNIIMPLGISFYTFKVISYLVDLHNNKVKKQNLFDLFIYVSFFPVLIAGPINRSKDFFIQLNKLKKFDYQDVKNGAVQCALGMFEKIVFADFIAIVVNNIFSNKELTGPYLILGIVLYSFQIYTDFDGYSNIAIGISRMLGFHIERNFHTPYLSNSIKEFWRRWHISLSSWLRDYIYIPLGGSHKGFLIKCINVLITFAISGIWHGSTLVFVIWGIGHGLFNIIEDIISRRYGKKRISKSLNILLIFINFGIVSFLWIFFRAASLDDAIRIISNIFIPMEFSLKTISLTFRQGIWLIAVLFAIIITDVLRNRTDMIEWIAKRNFATRWGFYILLIVIVIIFGIYGPGFNAGDFIYATF